MDYTVHTGDETLVFKGITKRLEDCKVFALVDFEGDEEIWGLESPISVVQLSKYYKQAFGVEGLCYRILTENGLWTDSNEVS